MGKTQGWVKPVAGVVAVGLVAGIGYTLYVAYPGGRPGGSPGGSAPSAPAALTSDLRGTDGGTQTGGTQIGGTDKAVAINPENQAPEGQMIAPAGAVQSYPAFDLVRIPPDGLATVAGRAEAGAEVAILVDGQEIAQTSANARGEFVALFDLAASDSPREMRLRSVSGAQTLDSAESVIIAPFAAVSGRMMSDTGMPDDNIRAEMAAVAVDGVMPEATEVQPGAGDAASASATGGAVATSILRTAEVGEAVDTGAQTQVDPTANMSEAAPVAPTVMIATDEGVKVLQQPGTEAGRLRIDAVSYDPEGRVFVSGRGAPGQVVRLYLMSTLKAEAEIGPDGQWRQELSDVAPGRYSLRADQVGADGQVSQRAEIPFLREDVAVLAGVAAADVAAPNAERGDTAQEPPSQSTEPAQPPAAPAKRITSVTVQPGNTLWGIASATYGDGVMYVRVFDANKSQIRDADLIYPGQIFVLPE